MVCKNMTSKVVTKGIMDLALTDCQDCEGSEGSEGSQGQRLIQTEGTTTYKTYTNGVTTNLCTNAYCSHYHIAS